MLSKLTYKEDIQNNSSIDVREMLKKAKPMLPTLGSGVSGVFSDHGEE